MKNQSTQQTIRWKGVERLVHKTISRAQNISQRILQSIIRDSKLWWKNLLTGQIFMDQWQDQR